jgi:hypothetical protein
MQRTAYDKVTEPPNDAVGLLLRPEYFEALMIEAVNRVFETAMVGRFVQKRFERLGFLVLVLFVQGSNAPRQVLALPSRTALSAPTFSRSSASIVSRSSSVPYSLPPTISVFSGVIW